MFLLPALCALASDALILGLHRSLVHDAVAAAAADDDDTSSSSGTHGKALYKVGYLTTAAWIRIFLLLFPLLFHSYTGTALPCHWMYLVLYTVTLVCVAAHMLALCLVVPESMEALVPEPEGFLQDLHLYRRLWYTLLLSVVSTAAHFVLVAHVKSSAPPQTAWRWASKNHTAGTGPSSSSSQPVSLYFAIRAHPVLQDEPALVHVMNGTCMLYVRVHVCVRLQLH